LSMKTRTLYIKTIGCQMNVYDSEQMAHLMRPIGFETTGDMESADMIIVNTCAIRAKAEQKLFSFLGRLTPLKHKNPGLLIGVGGCVAQQEGQNIFKRAPHVGFVFGTHALPRLPKIVEQAEIGGRHIVDVEMADRILEPEIIPLPSTNGNISRFVTIMHGCENFCTYCVVPHVRGKESSRSPNRILSEIRHMVDQGIREVTLLGQNVNSYGQKEGLCSFAELLRQVDAIQGLRRIRFTTSHPKDLSEDLMRAFSELDKLCPHIHLPVQSGSDRILKKMNRKYTRSEYIAKVEMLRRHCPDIAVSSDIIVGFPGETEAQFQQTLDLVDAVAFDSIFAFKYSDRPQAPATRFKDKVSETEKGRRLNTLLRLQDDIISRKNKALIGSTQCILIEGVSKKQAPDAVESTSQPLQWTGRTGTNKIVNFNAARDCDGESGSYIGNMISVNITKAFAHSLWGEPQAPVVETENWKGGGSCAA
jgi:tRNA-2-methylthio-N6-dimethylallyladenosine synthase